MRILVVDDEEHIRILLKTILTKEGFEVSLAKDGMEAYDMYLDTTFDMVLLDEMMPSMNGNELIEAIRKENPTIPLIMITAKSSIDDKAKSFGLGVDDYLTKPIIPEELLLRVNALFRRAKINLDKKIVVNDTILDSQTHRVYNEKEGLSTLLTKTEFEILYKLFSYPERIFTKWQLFEEFWGMDSDTNENIVKAYIFKIRKQIENYPELEIQTLMGVGYRGVKHEN